MEVAEIYKDYRNRDKLSPQDVIKCCLKVHQVESGVLYYDHRENLWNMRPGDVAWINDAFHLLMSYPRIDDTLKNVRCGHMDEEYELKKRRGHVLKCGCRKWYVYFKTEEGKVKKAYPFFNGMTVIPFEKINEILSRIGNEHLEKHFMKGYVKGEDVDKMLTEVRSYK